MDTKVIEATQDDRMQFAWLQGRVEHAGPQAAMLEALDSGYGFYPLLVASAALGHNLASTLEMLRLEPDETAEVIAFARWGCPQCGGCDYSGKRRECTCAFVTNPALESLM